MMESRPTRLIVGITGATGAIFGVRLLEALRGAMLGRSAVETHLIVSRWGAHTLAEETSYSLERVRQMATCSYQSTDQGAAVSSGSFLASGMVVAPCSVRTLEAIASGQGDKLIYRAASTVTTSTAEQKSTAERAREAVRPKFRFLPSRSERHA
jgi:4-hydroxy-3-polyprenylbenzoate decarboxylase